jgi:hypothetical protein
MSGFLPASEKRSFLLYLFIVCFSICCLFFGTVGLSLVSVTLGFFGFFRLIYFLEGHIKNIPSFMTLPGKILFGLSEKESDYKKHILKRLQQKDILFWFICGVLYTGWVIFCGLNIKSHDDISIIFKKDLTVVMGLSYLNIYETFHGIVWICISGLILFLALTYSQSKSFLKNSFIFFLPLFVGLSFLLGWYVFQKNNFVFSFPPFYTGLIQGIGIGKADLIYTYQKDIFLYPPTDLFKRYIEVGLVGIILFFILFLIPFLMFLKNIIRQETHAFYSFCASLVLLSLVIIDSFVIDPVLLRPLQIIGLTLVGLVWGHTKNAFKTNNH